MEDYDPLDPTPTAPAEASPATARAIAVPDPAAPPVQLDAHGFDPAAYDWIPVPRQRQRADGWTPHRQRQFIEALADTGSVTDAAAAAGMSVKSCYALRRAPHAAGFARAWDAAIEQAGKAMVDLAFERVIHGEEIPILNKEGQRIGSKRRYPEKLMIAMLRAFSPDRFGPADDRRQRTLTQPPATPPVAAALAGLEPVVPAEPHKLMPPEELAAFIEGEAFAAAEDKRFARAYPDAAAHEEACRVRRATMPAPPPPQAEPELSWEDYADREAAAEAKREARRAQRRKY